MTGREKLFIGGGIAVAGVLALFRDSVGSGIVQLSEKAMAALNFMQTEPGVQAFAAVLPERSKPYARAIVEAASYRGFSPFVVWAIMDHESALWSKQIDLNKINSERMSIMNEKMNDIHKLVRSER